MSNKAFQIVERKIYESSKLKFAGVDGYDPIFDTLLR